MLARELCSKYKIYSDFQYWPRMTRDIQQSKAHARIIFETGQKGAEAIERSITKCQKTLRYRKNTCRRLRRLERQGPDKYAITEET